jgi:hypothetical protein
MKAFTILVLCILVFVDILDAAPEDSFYSEEPVWTDVILESPFDSSRKSHFRVYLGA